MSRNGAQELKLFGEEESPIIQVEINLEEAPLFMIRKKGEDSDEQEMESRGTVLTRNGDRLEQYWKVTAHKDFGLPGAVDEAVFIAVMKLVSLRGGMPEDGRISFSLYELMKVLGKTRGANNYEKLRQSLDRLAETSIYAENAFYSQADEDFQTFRFHLWDVFFAKKTRNGRQTEHHTLKFTDVLVRSFNAGYMKNLDSDFYHSLGRDLARSLYRLIDVKRDGKLSWSVDLQRLRQMVSMPPSYKYASKIKEKLLPAHDELLERGYLDRAEIEVKGSGRGKTHVVHYRVSPAFIQERTDPGSDLSEPERYVVDGLRAHGMWSEKARQLVLEQGPDHCLYYLELLPYQKGVRDPGAWLRKYIENGWPVHVPDEIDGPGRTGSATGESSSNSSTTEPPGNSARPSDADSTGVDTSGRGTLESESGDPDARDIFGGILSELNASGSWGSSTRVQFDERLATSFHAGRLTLTVPGQQARDYIDSHLRGLLEAALRRRVGEHAVLRVECPAEEPAPTSEEFQQDFEARRDAGEFDRAIETFESLPYEEYRKWVGHEPLHPDGNHYFVSREGDLYVCVGGRGSEHRYFLCHLDRTHAE